MKASHLLFAVIGCIMAGVLAQALIGGSDTFFGLGLGLQKGEQTGPFNP